MSILKDILNKIGSQIKTKKDYKNKIIEEIFNISNIKLVEDEIFVKNNTLFLKTTPTKKYTIFLYKASVLQNLKELNIYSIN